MFLRKNNVVIVIMGMVSIQLRIGVIILYYLCGIIDCRYSQQRFYEFMRSDDRFVVVKDRIQKVEVFFIDEIGMLLKKVFEVVEFVYRLVCGNVYVFGGFQFISVYCFK